MIFQVAKHFFFEVISIKYFRSIFFEEIFSQ